MSFTGKVLGEQKQTSEPIKIRAKIGKPKAYLGAILEFVQPVKGSFWQEASEFIAVIIVTRAGVVPIDS